MTPDHLDDSFGDTATFGDTVRRPIPTRGPIVDAEPDVEDTMPVGAVPRPATGPIAHVAPKIATAPIEVVQPELRPQPQPEPEPEVAQPEREPEQEPESHPEPDADDADTVVPPIALVEPPTPAPRRPPSLPPLRGSDIPDVSDNVWSEPLPQKARPFRLLLDDGTIVPLDQPVYLGRKPSVPRIHPGGVPLLVTMDSPQREVSSTHLELTTVGGAIVASDLKSTNGSIVRLPGAPARTLVAGASAVVTPGTVIELGDGNTVELLAPDYEGVDEEPDFGTDAGTGASE